jgi:hypothetical protein
MIRTGAGAMGVCYNADRRNVVNSGLKVKLISEDRERKERKRRQMIDTRDGATRLITQAREGTVSDDRGKRLGSCGSQDRGGTTQGETK